MSSDPRVEYEQAQQEYNNARAALAQAQASQSVSAMNDRLGTYNESQTSRGVGALLGTGADLSAIDAQQRMDAASRRLDAAMRSLPQNINIHQGN